MPVPTQGLLTMEPDGPCQSRYVATPQIMWRNAVTTQWHAVTVAGRTADCLECSRARACAVFLATYTNPHAFIAVGDPWQLRAATQQTAQTGRCGIVADAHTGPDIQQNL